MDLYHTLDIKDPAKWQGVSQFSAAKALLRDVTDNATRSWVFSLYKHNNPGVTDEQIEAMEWPTVMKAVTQPILDGFDSGAAPDDVRLLLFGGNHSTWALQLMIEEGLHKTDPSLLKRYG
jgi:hypothetical protein